MLIQISSGQGSPKECEFASNLLYQELLKEFLDLEVIMTNFTEKQCLKSAIFYSSDDLSYLDGTVQWICQSPFRANYKRKNWYIDISILKEQFRFDKLNDIRFETFRSAGKGGQNVNKTSTAVRAIHLPTKITAVSSSERSQIINKRIAYLRLMEKMDEQSSSINKVIQYENWNKHNKLIRGNPIRIYKGMSFKRVLWLNNFKYNLFLLLK